MKKRVYLSGFLIVLSCSVFAQYTELVNPFIGTGGHGHTYPGATTPFGMVQLSPDTRLDGWDGCGGYHYSDNIIYGFSHTHLSGTGVPDYCDVLLMPTVGKPQLVNMLNNDPETGYASKFSHTQEKAAPGYYAVLLEENKIEVELTATARVGFHKYSFPQTDKANIVLDLTHRDRLLDSSYIRIVSPTKIEGLRRSTGWASDQWVYFAIEFSQPFTTESHTQNALTYAFQFKANGKNSVYVKCALSAVSTAGAWKNMEQEIPEWDFEKIKQDAAHAWNRQLGKIEVSGNDLNKKIIFYTALYHTMVVPNIYCDVDGSYRGRDHAIHNTNNLFDYYTVFSLWDTYRAAHPLYTIIEQKRTTDFINTFLKQYEQAGKLPVWELAGNETECMIGYHAVSVIADAAVKEIKGFDAQEAYEAMKHSAETDLFGLKYYRDKGFIESNEESESVSRTLEYSYDDFCIARMGALLKTDNYFVYSRRAQNWMSLYDGEFMRPRVNGGWYTPFDPYEVNFNYTEANAWQYAFAPQHEIGNVLPQTDSATLATAQKKLNTLFTADSITTGREQSDISGLIGQYAHGNEPSHHLAYLFDYVNAPLQTQYYVNKICTEFYKNAPDGLIGNEDCGQMSAWYVFSAMGFYPVCPGKPEYAIGAPLFDKVIIHADGGNDFSIDAKNISDKNIYVKDVNLNGNLLSNALITHADIMQGGNISFEMTGQKMTGLKGIATKPDSVMIPRAPIISYDRTVFTDSVVVSIIPFDTTYSILYSVNAMPPLVAAKAYTKPFIFKDDITLKAMSKNKRGSAGYVSAATFKKLTPGYSLHYLTNYSSQYTAGGDYALVDGVRGSKNFRTGGWQGWEGESMEVIVDLGKIKRVNGVTASYLQDLNSWIWLPAQVEVWSSDDGLQFTLITTIGNTIAQKDYNTTAKDFIAGFSMLQTRYVKITAKNVGPIPAWHEGAGKKAWIFCDEIIVK